MLYCDNLHSFFSKLKFQVTVIKNLAEEEGKDSKAFLKQQPFAKPGEIFIGVYNVIISIREKLIRSRFFFLPSFPENVRKVVSETYMLLKSKLTSTLQSMALFLANKDTEYILFKPCKVRTLHDVSRHQPKDHNNPI